ncbi:precorrin-6y C5,15-methyltransferase (decarboxylating) subunit CbiE [Marinomonas epiphytica]
MKIHVVGLGITEPACLTSAPQALLTNLTSDDLLIASERQLAMVKFNKAVQVRVLPKLVKLESLLLEAQTDRVSRVVVLASGDPLYYGIGAWLGRFVKAHSAVMSIQYYSNVSSIQGACERLGLSQQDVTVLSVHGRPLNSIRPHLQANKTLVLLTDQNSSPNHIAKEVVAAGLLASRLSVCERMGYKDEKVRHFEIGELLESPVSVDPLNVVVVFLAGQSVRFVSAPGIPDEYFVTDKGAGKGMITKREVRLAVLSYLQPNSGDIIWDIGAGCGGVSVELAYWQPKAQIYAVEHHDERLFCLRANQEQFGVSNNLTLIEGRAPQALAALPSPNKVFIGGSDGDLVPLLEQVWESLPQGGVLLVSCVTETTRFYTMQFSLQRANAQDCQELTRQLAVSKGEQLAGQNIFRPNLPVTLYQFTKVTGN